MMVLDVFYKKHFHSTISGIVQHSLIFYCVDISTKIIYNPEFLREKHANEDFMNSEMIIFGGDKDIASQVSKFYL